MTKEEREEAIKYFEDMKKGIFPFYANWLFDIAIKALEQEPCDYAISRQAVLDLIEHYNSDGLGSVFYSYEDGMKFADAINKLQPVIPEVKTGYWVEENVNGGGRRVYCSECGCAPPFEHVSTGDVYSANGYGVINKTKFCHSCGTRMIEPKESEVQK